MKVAFCYESVLPARGGCETYIADLARRLVADRHEVHLYACRWDEKALPAGVRYHGLPAPRGPRFLRPWRFGALCEQALRAGTHDVSIGFDKTWGQDVLYPQGGLHSASADYNLRKYPGGVTRALARVVKALDLAHWSYRRLERRQYLRHPRPLVVVNSHMVRGHFQQYYNVPTADLFVVRSAIDAKRFPEHDRPRRRLEWRQRWGLGAEETVGLFAAMNYRLKGLDPLLHAVRCLCVNGLSPNPAFRLLVVGNPDSGKYQQLARRLGVERHVRFAGHCPEMRNAYFAADFLVHPTFYDPCSLVVLEALACGLPVITTRANGASELLSPLQEGYVLDDPHDHARLAWCLGQLLDPARRSVCAHAARRTAARWTFEYHYRQLLDVFAEAAARRRAA
ncbi:MAG: glycosyltransferase family 4 protein [Gemmataceae bacterium]|nr:glycosyltransferase family 4 protein [Gemmataceae bacterium]